MFRRRKVFLRLNNSKDVKKSVKWRSYSCRKLFLKTSPGNTNWGSVIVPLTSCFTGLDKSVMIIKTKIVSCHIADSRPVKQEVKGTMILPPLVFPDFTNF